MELRIVRIICVGLTIIFILGIGVTAKLIANIINSPTITWLINSIFLFCIGFFLLSVAASITDWYLGFNPPFLNAVVNAIAFGLIFSLVAHTYWVLTHEPPNLHITEGKEVENPRYIDKETLKFHGEELIKELQLQNTLIKRVKNTLKKPAR